MVDETFFRSINYIWAIALFGMLIISLPILLVVGRQFEFPRPYGLHRLCAILRVWGNTT